MDELIKSVGGESFHNIRVYQISMLCALNILQFYLPIKQEKKILNHDRCYKTKDKENCVLFCPSCYRFLYILISIIAFHLENNPEALPPIL